MSIESQHQQFVRDIRNGRAHAADLVGRYEPFKTSDGCVKHMFLDDDKCSDCARRARERNEDRQVDRFREELWREQRDYDAEVARDRAADEKNAARSRRIEPTPAPRHEATPGRAPSGPVPKTGLPGRKPGKKNPVPEWFIKGEEPPGPHVINKGGGGGGCLLTLAVLFVLAFLSIKFIGALFGQF